MREAIQKYFKERDCHTLIRPINDESKLAHIEDLKYEELKLDFRKQVASLISSVKKKMRPKVINGKVLNASMFLSLTLEYTEALNSKETPTVITAIDRVVQAEATKISDEIYDHFCDQIKEDINEDTMPLSKSDFRKIIKRSIKKFKKDLQVELSRVLSFSEIIQETSKFS